DAILYALYARVVRPPPEKGRTRNEDIIAYGAGEATVVLDFAVGDRRFRVSRTIHRSGRPRANLDEILEDGTVKPLAVGQEQVTEQVEKLLGGITYNEMVSSTVVAQKDLDKLIELKKEDRKKIINIFLNLESFNTALESLDEQHKTLEGTRERAGQIQIERNKLETLRQELEDFERKKRRRAETLKEREELESKLQQLEKEYGNIDLLYRSLRDYGEALQRRQTLELEIASKKDRYQTDRKRRSELLTTLESLKKQLKEYSDLENMELTLSEIRGIADMLKTLEAREAEVESALQRADQKVKELEGWIPHGVSKAEIEKRLREGKKPLQPLVIGSLLSMFGAIVFFLLNSLTTAIPLFSIGIILLALTVLRVSKISRLAHLHELHMRLESFDQAVKSRDLLRQKQATLSDERRQKEEYLITFCSRTARYRDILYENIGNGVLQAVETVLRHANSGLQTLNSLKTRFDTIKEELSKLPTQEDLEDVEEEVKALEKRLEDTTLPTLPENMTYSRELEEKTDKHKEELAGEIERCKTKISLNNSQIVELEEWLNAHGDVWERFRQQEETVARLEREIRIVKKTIEGIQATAEALRKRVKPSVQSYMSIILPALTNGRYKAAIIDEDYKIQVYDPDAGQFRVKEVFSGGTEDQFL
ncbi:AAA family ATPase, partial [Candidatus Bathyarchaeota archaeon]|nr:AAA family ATPase [Candidatus Bathyarchaeota archaeon]